MYSSSPKRPAATGMSRALFQSMTCTSWSASSVRTVGRSSVAKCPEIGPTRSTCGWSVTSGLAKCSRLANGVEMVGRTSTWVTRPSTTTESMPQSGRTWVGRAEATISHAALSWRGPVRPAKGAGRPSTARTISLEVLRAGATSRRCHSYAVYRI